MINKLLKNPKKLTEKDAVYVAIMSVIAGEDIGAGENCQINKNNEAIPGGKLGIANPFGPTKINKGELFWLVMHPEKVYDLSYTWEHEYIDTDKDNLKNIYLVKYANKYRDRDWETK